MRIHSVFHKKLLEPAPLDAELATDIELEDDEYEVEEIKDLRKISNQPMVRIAVVRQQEGPYQGQSSPQPALSPDPKDSRWQDPDQQTLALVPWSLEARDEDEKFLQPHERP
ncbi:hypothetical protein COCSADRAFT_160370 [Bipolaris sorokiniana ND90Pr]|uniref:Uncharacterized protein n=1 Tax=Cochliobolus sativus (strain ND90Pr / ATCC 201652) TaxID=665912 RepID=M2RBC0_COCSN|nr:uncharacterized protein COCSADRAFT_160370 [Bipolaris sorokiniana ND90Pr]EMD64124.1 hypothetical protein COCSADRAFT_160370 [Bipolaris sorokiniana ND90Pr]